MHSGVGRGCPHCGYPRTKSAGVWATRPHGERFRPKMPHRSRFRPRVSARRAFSSERPARRAFSSGVGRTNKTALFAHEADDVCKDVRHRPGRGNGVVRNRVGLPPLLPPKPTPLRTLDALVRSHAGLGPISARKPPSLRTTSGVVCGIGRLGRRHG